MSLIWIACVDYYTYSMWTPYQHSLNVPNQRLLCPHFSNFWGVFVIEPLLVSDPAIFFRCLFWRKWTQIKLSIFVYLFEKYSPKQSSMSPTPRVAIGHWLCFHRTGLKSILYFSHCHLSHIYKAEKHSILGQRNLSVQSLWFLFLPPSLSSPLSFLLSCIDCPIWQMGYERQWKRMKPLSLNVPLLWMVSICWSVLDCI